MNQCDEHQLGRNNVWGGNYVHVEECHLTASDQQKNLFPSPPPSFTILTRKSLKWEQTGKPAGGQRCLPGKSTRDQIFKIPVFLGDTKRQLLTQN